MGTAGHRGKPIGVAEITKKRRNVLGAVSMAYPGTQKPRPTASSSSCAARRRSSTASTPCSAMS